jgi:hypothetical protein
MILLIIVNLLIFVISMNVSIIISNKLHFSKSIQDKVATGNICTHKFKVVIVEKFLLTKYERINAL